MNKPSVGMSPVLPFVLVVALEPKLLAEYWNAAWRVGGFGLLGHGGPPQWGLRPESSGDSHEGTRDGCPTFPTGDRTVTRSALNIPVPAVGAAIVQENRGLDGPS